MASIERVRIVLIASVGRSVVIGGPTLPRWYETPGMRTLTSASLVSMWACGGKPAPATVQPAQPAPSTSQHAPAVTPGAPAPKAVADTHEPEYFAPLQTKVAVGQTIVFGTAVI